MPSCLAYLKKLLSYALNFTLYTLKQTLWGGVLNNGNNEILYLAMHLNPGRR